MHGGGCKNELGWYNATENPATKPADDQIYTLVPVESAAGAAEWPQCDGPGLLPAGHAMMTTQAAQHSWVDPLPTSPANIRTSPNYKGGLIGLALMAASRGSRSARRRNTRRPSSTTRTRRREVPWMTTLDLPVGCRPAGLLHRVRGSADLRDELAGLHCSSVRHERRRLQRLRLLRERPLLQPRRRSLHGRGRDGDLRGRHHRVRGGGTTTTCRQTVMPSPEKCDNQDNDCNGMVDEGDGLCPPVRGLQPGCLPARLRRHRVPLRGRPHLRQHRRPVQGSRLHRQDLQRGTGLPAGRLRRRLRRRHVPARADLPARELRRRMRRRHLSDGSGLRERRLPAAVQQQVPHLQGRHDVQHDQRRLRGDGLREQDLSRPARSASPARAKTAATASPARAVRSA